VPDPTTFGAPGLLVSMRTAPDVVEELFPVTSVSAWIHW
jgi:hypothetical protein